MPGKSKKIKEMGYEGGYPMMGDKSANMMKPAYKAHHPMKMKSPYNMKPQILKHMSGK
jgi:hypothetical protein